MSYNDFMACFLTNFARSLERKPLMLKEYDRNLCNIWRLHANQLVGVKQT